MAKKIFNRSKKNIYKKSENFYKEKEFERNFLKINPNFKENEIEKYKYFTDCRDYLNNFVYFPPNNLGNSERFILEKAITTLSPLAKPYTLADFLKIDIDYIYDALEDGYLPHFNYGSSYFIKTAEIIKFMNYSDEKIFYKKEKRLWKKSR